MAGSSLRARCLCQERERSEKQKISNPLVSVLNYHLCRVTAKTSDWTDHTHFQSGVFVSNTGADHLNHSEHSANLDLATPHFDTAEGASSYL